MKATSWTSLKDYHQIKGIEKKLPYNRIRISKLLKEEQPKTTLKINGKKTNIWEYKGAMLRKAGGSILIKDL